MASRLVLPFADVGSGIAPAAGAKLEFFASGTSTPKDTFTDEALTVPNDNPVIADANGVFGGIWMQDGDRYKVRLLDKNNVQQWESDPVIGGLSSSGLTFDTVASMKLASPEVGAEASTLGYLSAGDGGAATYLVEASAVVDEFGDHTLANGNIVRLQNASNRIEAAQYGMLNDGSDIGAAVNAAAVAANASNRTMILPAGVLFQSSISLDWSLLIELDAEGAGHFNTLITFTTDVDGIQFGGRRLEGLRVTGIGALATGDGIIYTGLQRKFAQRLQADGFFNGHRYDEGNMSHFNFIFGVSNANHGFVNNNNTFDHHAATVGMMDLRGNGGDGFHITSDVPNFVGQQMYGGTIVCQSNSGNAANISGRGHNLSIYDEANVGDVLLDSNSEGNQITIPFGSFTDNGANNDVIAGRVGSVEAWVHSNLQWKQSELNNRDFSGRLIESVTANRTFERRFLGSGSDATYSLIHDAGGSIALNVEGRINSKKITNTDLSVSLDASDGNLIELTNSGATSITVISGGAESQVITLVFMDGNTTVVSGTVLRLAGGANFAGNAFDTLTLAYNNPDWHEISRSSNA